MSGQPPRFASRELYAAAHVAGDGAGGIDWDATLRYRHVLWGHGLGVAEAMDTAQRGMGLSWPLARALIERTVEEGRAVGGSVLCGAATDQLVEGDRWTLDDIAGAYEEQCEAIEAAGGRIVLMASRQLAAVAAGPADYAAVYARVLAGVAEPVVIHWLGPTFDPSLAGYWGADELDAATESCLSVLHEHRARIAGIKLSLLDAGREVELRRRLPEGMRMYTGDDHHYVDLILGDGTRHSDALLGVLDALAPAVPAAMAALDAGDDEGFERVLGPTVPLARHLFGAPTPDYKTGLVWLAYLNGHQDRFSMLDRLESRRSPQHLLEALRLAEQAGVVPDPERARDRARRALASAAAA